MAASLKFLVFLAVAVACVLAFPGEESERVRKQVYYSGYPGYSAYSAPAYSAYSAPAYSAYSAPLAYSGYSAPLAYSGAAYRYY